VLSNYDKSKSPFKEIKAACSGTGFMNRNGVGDEPVRLWLSVSFLKMHRASLTAETHS
jgi:hypothetical protein